MAASKPCDVTAPHAMHSWGAGPPFYGCPGVPILGADCRDGKHLACVGDAWDTDTDTPTPCQCDCHKEANREH